MPLNPDDFAAKTDTQKLDAIATALAIDVGERIDQVVPPELRKFTVLNLRQIMRIAAEKMSLTPIN